MREIAIVGCGLAGFHATRQLEDKITGRRRVRLTVVTRRADFVFSPLLTAVATGQLAPDHITASLQDSFGDRTRVIVDDVEFIDTDDGRLETDSRSIPFDYLLVTPGSRRSGRAFDGADELVGPDTLDDAVAIRRRVAELAGQDHSFLRFAVVGATPTGIQWAGQLATCLAADHDRYCRDDDVEIIIYEARDRLLPDHSRRLSDEVTDHLEQLGIEIRTGRPVESATPTSVELADGTSVSTSMTLHCASRVGASLSSRSGLTTDENGRLVVDSDLGVPDHPHLFAAGDAVAAPGEPAAKYDPQLARQQGRFAARNLVAAMSGRARESFEFDDRGHFITLGADHTILELGGVHLKGRPAWLAYRLYYTALMPRSIQKVALLRDWISSRSPGPSSSLPDGGIDDLDED